MNDTVVEVKGVSKVYRLGMGKRTSGGYTALRDVLSNSIKRAFLLVTRSAEKGATVSKTIDGEFYALKNICFEIRKGQRVAIIGRNGAGKSTLLKILSRITEPSEGEIEITGRVSSLLEVGTGFHPELTGRENIFLNGAILGMSRKEIDAKLKEIIEFAEIERFLDTPVKHYSSGMYVRLAFSVAAHLEPDILIIDEVLAVGDAKFQKKCMGKIEEQSSAGRTVLFVSHNMTAVRALCEKAILIRDGQVVLAGDVDSVISAYQEDIRESASKRRVWDDEATAPQNSMALLSEASLRNENGIVIEELSTNSEVYLNIEFKVKYPGVSVGFTLVVHDSDGVCVFSSINNLDVNNYGRPLIYGFHRAVCHIPKNLFNAGVYYFSINMFGANFSDAHFEKDVLMVDFMDSSEIRGDYHGAYSGAVRPLLNWSMFEGKYDD